MNKKVYVLAIAAFVVGTVELILGGILDLIATDLHLSYAKAGYLISIFSLVYAISAPILLNVTARFERKKVYLCTLVVFLMSNLISAFSVNFYMLMAGRALGAATGSLIFVLSLTLAARIVEPQYKGRAVGIITMGGSASLILGVPLGIFVGNMAGWREVFIFIAILTALVIVAISIAMDRVQPIPVVPLKKQLSALWNPRMLAIHATTLLVLAGHLTLYAYFTPFLQATIGASSTMVTFIYVMFGIAAVAGGGIGGLLSDRLHPAKAIIIVLVPFMITMALIPVSVGLPLIAFLLLLSIWSALSWTVTPVQNSLIIKTSPETADTLISTNSGIAHAGIALGTYIGGMVIDHSAIQHTGWVGSILILLGLVTAIYAITRKEHSARAVA
ncbi:MFS transporter [Paenibacillus sp. Root52]|uniref:DHA1 family purine base/nucleoside efflux pump-like MFS transporter n=1 Tax=Paenibacillus amylolyticus TaxID=1451 RepID=A0AAP5LT36_PAEAM|nr:MULTISPECIES: MFS transporter [Paenibacillus]KQY94782.1 MFS transporter [Paenibacillus sp. Root52]MDR6726229.1 DHA1 family purine base/nucleoside efflux pump-like MFS transporter [Paenibacillus amylolyticus]